jgi:hypothetical protein
MDIEKIIFEAAKAFMLAYLSDGTRKQPSDFDRDIINSDGEVDFLFSEPNWNGTPFFYALGDLVKEGKVKFEKDEKGEYWYWIGA